MAIDSEPLLRLRRTEIDEGWSDEELSRLVRAGELERLRRGAYVAGPLPADVAVLHRLLVRATLAGLRLRAVVSHQSTAVLHGLPLWDAPLDRVHVTREPNAWNHVGRVLRRGLACAPLGLGRARSRTGSPLGSGALSSARADSSRVVPPAPGVLHHPAAGGTPQERAVRAAGPPASR